MRQIQGEPPEIVVREGYDLTEVIDTDDMGYGFEQEGFYREEVTVRCERDGKE